MQEFEEWRTVPDHPMYEASTMGRIRNLRGKILTPVLRPHGYLKIRLCRDGHEPTQLYVHQVIAMTFIPGYDRKLNNMVVDHINEIKDDCRLANLQFVTQKRNIQLSVERKKEKKGVA